MPWHRPIPDSKPRGKTGGALDAYVQTEKLMQIAFVLPAAVGLGLAAGWWLSNLLHHKWIEAVGIVLGCVSGLVYVIQMAIAAEKSTASKDPAQTESEKGIENSGPNSKS